MKPHHFLTAQRVLIVAGKGGVGKSAVAGSLALLAAQSGLRALLVSFDAETIEVPAHERLERVTVTPGNALTDYLASKGMGLISRQLAKSGIVELVATTAPGLDDLLVLGRIKAFEKELRADIIIVDGPAAGHAIDLVRAPLQLKRALASGPIAQQADEVLAMLADGARCKILMVTTPATFTNNVFIGGDLTVSGNIILDAIGFDDLQVSGSATIANTLSVTGNTTLINANVTQNLIANNFNGNANTKIFTAIESAEATALAFSIALG